jgi:hypothetical protein
MIGGTEIVSTQRVAEHVANILAERGIDACWCAEDGSYLVEHARTGLADAEGSSAAVIIDFRMRGDDILVVLLAQVLEQVRLSPVERFALLESLNRLNGDVDFGKFYLDGEDIYLRYDLPARDFEPDELIKPLLTLARIADEQDDRLMAQLGSGLRAADVIARLQESVGS